jgi:hypothetical protein
MTNTNLLEICPLLSLAWEIWEHGMQFGYYNGGKDRLV